MFVTTYLMVEKEHMCTENHVCVERIPVERRSE
jgi:hypothetical protein